MLMTEEIRTLLRIQLLPSQIRAAHALMESDIVRIERYRAEHDAMSSELTAKALQLYNGLLKQWAVAEMGLKSFRRDYNDHELRIPGDWLALKNVSEACVSLRVRLEKVVSLPPEFPVNKAIFCNTGWGANTSVGTVYWLFEDEDKQLNPFLEKEAQAVVDQVVRTKQPPFGGWM